MGELTKVADKLVARRRCQLLELQELCATLPDQIVPSETVEHHFAPGVYMREFRMKAGMLVIGHIMRHEFLSTIIQGKVHVADENGSRIITAPHIWNSPPGAKRAGIFLEDTIWLSVHPNPDNERDIDVLETELFVPSYAALEEYMRLEI